MGARRYSAQLFLPGRKFSSLGTWSTQREADIARDRAILYLGLDRPLRLPRASKRLGPASPVELRGRARMIRKARECSCKFIGVFRKQENRWAAEVISEGKTHSVGTFDNPRDAAVARDRAARYLLGYAAPMNFPELDLEPASPLELKKERQRILGSEKSSTYRGVALGKSSEKPWVAHIRVGGRLHALGSWQSEREAAIAYDRAALHFLGDAAVPNIPRVSRRLGPAAPAELCAMAHMDTVSRQTSRFHGVRLDRTRGRYLAVIRAEGRKHYLGSFDSEHAAAVIYDSFAVQLHGERARLNFHPTTGEVLCGRYPLWKLKARDSSA